MDLPKRSYFGTWYDEHDAADECCGNSDDCVMLVTLIVLLLNVAEHEEKLDAGSHALHDYAAAGVYHQHHYQRIIMMTVLMWE